MGATAIQKKLDKAHKKVGLKLGEEFGLYRPIINTSILNLENWMADVKATYTLSDSYTTALNWQVPVWTCYTEAALIAEGDFLYNDLTEKTYFILARQPLLPVLALECPHKASLQTVGYGNTGTGFAPGALTYIAEDIPGFMQYGSTTKSGSYPGANSKAGVRTATFITTFPNPEMLMGAILTDAHGFKGNVIGYDYSALGKSVKITAQEMDTPQ